MQLLAIDPGLGRQLEADRFAEARSTVQALPESLPPGPWVPPPVEPLGLGILLVRGIFLREVVLAGRSFTELLGPGDLLRPWVWDEEPATLVSGLSWEIVTPAAIVVLDRHTTASMRAWPELDAELLDRTVRRSMSLAVHLAIAHLPGLEHRLLALLWHLADRWGGVRADHVLVELPLTHELLGRLVGAGRASVTTALHRLVARGQVSPAPGRAWRLHGRAPDVLELT